VTVQALARRAAFDALAMSGPPEAGGGFMRTTDPAAYFDDQRLALAREALALAGKDRHTISADELAERLVPRIRELVQAGALR
jgi:hypothetical protein